MNNNVPNLLRIAQDGQLYTRTTGGTPIATGTSVPTGASIPATTPLIVVKNNSPIGSGIRTWVHSLNIVQIGGTVPASVTSVQAAVVVDSGDRTPTANLTLATPNNVVIGGRASTSQVWQCNAGNLTVPAASSAAITTARRQIRSGITVLLDEYELRFGSEAPVTKMPTAVVGSFATSLPALVIQPQHFALIYLWFPGGATNAFTHEYEMVLSERG
jgi:hypothetical protein